MELETDSLSIVLINSLMIHKYLIKNKAQPIYYKWKSDTRVLKKMTLWKRL
jgi:hypothetical protein